jgi:creatinine amidohydrolase
LSDRGRRLADASWPEAELGAPGSILVVPLGATEQHGPHLPLSTDSDIALALARELAARREEVVVAPFLPYGSSGEHAGFAGTLSIGAEATELVLVELCRSATAAYERVLLLSTHGGNAEPVGRAVARLREEGRDVRAWGPRWGGDAHAGRTETSVMLALDAGRVSGERAECGNVDPIDELIARLVEVGVREVSANGVLGDPGGASAERGCELLEVALADLEALLAAWPAPMSEPRVPR